MMLVFIVGIAMGWSMRTVAMRRHLTVQRVARALHDISGVQRFDELPEYNRRLLMGRARDLVFQLFRWVP